MNSPVGSIELTTDDKFLVRLDILTTKKKASVTSPKTPIMKQAVKELTDYFAGKLKQFTVPTKQDGTQFQKDVWNVMAKIPFGKVLTYGEVAKKVGKPLAPRAVGGACNKNAIGIIIPCHRIIGSNKKLTGYASGIENKEWLLKHEGVL